MRRVTLTGERLDDDHALYGPDLARHRSAYQYAIHCASTEAERPDRILDLGCGNGYGSAELADACGFVVALDRITPDPQHRRDSLHYVCADLSGVPLAWNRFDLVVSFQVIEHLEDPAAYLEAIAAVVKPRGVALVTTPNIRQSDGVNPFHVHEYEGDELRDLLLGYFEEVEMLGVGMSPAAARYQADRLRRIHRIMKLDPFGLRERIPRRWIDWLFARLSVVVRRGIERGEGLPDLTPEDFPIGPGSEASLDLLAVCRGPRSS